MAAPTIIELQDMRAALVAARASGALRLTFRSGGTERTIEHKSDAQMAAAIGAIDRELAGINGQRVHTFLATFNSGL